MSDQVSGDTGRTPLADVLGAAIQLAESRWERGEPDGVVLSLFVARELARALAPEPSGVPPETDGTQLVVGWVARATLLEILNEGGCWGGVDRNGEAYLTDGADRIVARVVARLSGATPKEETRDSGNPGDDLPIVRNL